MGTQPIRTPSQRTRLLAAGLCPGHERGSPSPCHRPAAGDGGELPAPGTAQGALQGCPALLGGFMGVSHVPGRALPPDPVARRDHQDPNVCAAGLLASEILRRLGGENSSSVL